MPRTYVSRTRDDSMARTRAGIVDVARDLLPASGELSVDAIAGAAGVSVQTLYSHFGSKRGLLLAVIDTVQRDVGLYVDFEKIWRSPDGESALRGMLAATFRLWAGAWPIVHFSERARRMDPEIEKYMRQIDGYRLANLRSITEQLAVEGRLRNGLGADTAADLAFSMSMPTVHEQLVVVRGVTPERAAALMSEAVIASIVEPGTAPPCEPADWSGVLRPPVARAGAVA